MIRELLKASKAGVDIRLLFVGSVAFHQLRKMNWKKARNP